MTKTNTRRGVGFWVAAGRRRALNDGTEPSLFMLQDANPTLSTRNAMIIIAPGVPSSTRQTRREEENGLKNKETARATLTCGSSARIIGLIPNAPGPTTRSFARITPLGRPAATAIRE